MHTYIHMYKILQIACEVCIILANSVNCPQCRLSIGYCRIIIFEAKDVGPTCLQIPGENTAVLMCVVYAF